MKTDIAQHIQKAEQYLKTYHLLGKLPRRKDVKALQQTYDRGKYEMKWNIAQEPAPPGNRRD